jgi:hypothetical protein
VRPPEISVNSILGLHLAEMENNNPARFGLVASRSK